MFTTELEIAKHWNSVTIKHDGEKSGLRHDWINTITSTGLEGSRVILHFAKPEDVVPFAETLLEQAKDALKQPKEAS